MPAHLGGLDASVVRTPTFELAELAIGALTTRPGLGLVSGPQGAGVSFAVAAAMEELEDVRVAGVSCTQTMSLTDVYRFVVDELTGAPADGDLYGLRRQTMAVADQDRVLICLDRPQLAARWRVIDEALWLVENTRHASVVLTGDDALREAVGRRPHVLGALSRTVDADLLDPGALTDTLREFHSFYEPIDGDLLDLIDREYLYGSFKAWAQFTLDAIELCAGNGERLTANRARGLIAQIRGARAVAANQLAGMEATTVGR